MEHEMIYQITLYNNYIKELIYFYKNLLDLNCFKNIWTLPERCYIVELKCLSTVLLAAVNLCEVEKFYR
jgi:hypothetical protein